MVDQTSPQVHRLIELTQQRRLGWTYLYPMMMDLEDEDLSDATAPRAYVLEDAEYGFGFVTLRLPDPMNEDATTALFIHGEEVDATDTDLGTLVDSVRVFFSELQGGTVPPVGERIRRQIEASVAPFQQALMEQSSLLDRQFEFSDRQLSVIDKLATALVGGPTLNQTASAAPESDEQIGNPGVFARRFLRELLGINALQFNEKQIEAAIAAALYGDNT